MGWIGKICTFLTDLRIAS